MRVDSHLHLADDAFAHDLEAVLERAHTAGVTHFFTNSTCEADWACTADIASSHSGIIPGFGIHPWFVGGLAPGWEERLEARLLSCPSFLGECGLDRVHAPRDEALQEKVLRTQVMLAKNLGRPLAIHGARAWGWLLETLENLSPLPPFLLHSYGGSVEMVPAFAKLGAHFSFSAAILSPKNTKMRISLLAIPQDRLHMETDAPDMSPPEHSGRNEPANLPLVLAQAAQLLGRPEEILAGQLSVNAHALWGDLLHG
ncbi:MAG: hypothetical protein A2018_02985 [Alphaproteobacteria bacterium GWF2_58_20]|nr:MAG: hypothetical protein A2018_02985 [Alphaproteobacteria bacterium GWF2_58_20]